MKKSVDRPHGISALPLPHAQPPGPARTTCVSRDFLPKWTAGPEGWTRPNTLSEQTSATAASGCRSGAVRRRRAGVPRRSARRRPPRARARLAESRQDRTNRLGIFDRRNQPQPPSAARARQHIDVEGPAGRACAVIERLPPSAGRGDNDRTGYPLRRALYHLLDSALAPSLRRFSRPPPSTPHLRAYSRAPTRRRWGPGGL